jgi:hypothetical protein
MNPRIVAGLVDALIPTLGGVYATLLGYRIVGKKPGESFDYDRWHERYGTMLRRFGPLIIVLGIFLAVKSVVLHP